MSRSFKHTPICKDGDSGKYGKNQANRHVRQHKGEIPNGKGYKKHYSSYDIHDSIGYYSKVQWLSEIEANRNAEASGINRWPHLYRATGQSWYRYYYRK